MIFNYSFFWGCSTITPCWGYYSLLLLLGGCEESLQWMELRESGLCHGLELRTLVFSKFRLEASFWAANLEGPKFDGHLKDSIWKPDSSTRAPKLPLPGAAGHPFLEPGGVIVLRVYGVKVRVWGVPSTRDST